MSDFPILRSGAVVQFPSSRTIEYSTEVIQFVDGSEQRFRDYSKAYRRWIVKFGELNETELQNIRQFVQSMNGRVGLFSFTDPWDGTIYQKCSIETEVHSDLFAGPERTGTNLVIREHFA